MLDPRVGFWPCSLCVLFLRLTACASPSRDDLKRALQRLPRPAYQGTSTTHSSEVLNEHLKRHYGGSVVACSDISLTALAESQKQLLDVRHREFDNIYRRAADRRALSMVLGNTSQEPLESLKASLLVQEQLLLRRPDLSDIVRDARCRLVVLWFVHHLSDEERVKVLRSSVFQLPLLPHSSRETFQERYGDEDFATALRVYDNSLICMPCHINGTAPSPAPTPAPSHKGPAFVPWPDNVNYTLYAGMSGCCAPSNNYTEIRKIYRRWKYRQQLDINLYADCSTFMKPSFVNNCSGGGFEPQDRTCMLDDCHAGLKPNYAQHATCHIFYNATDIWEFWPTLRKCTKLIAGAGMPPPSGLTDSFDVDPETEYFGVESMGDAPDVTKNRTCHKWCQKQPAFSPSCYWMHEDGTPCKHHFPNGIDFYGSKANGDWVELEEDPGPIIAELPDYCPPQDTPALLGAVFPNQENICTQWWFNGVDMPVPNTPTIV